MPSEPYSTAYARRLVRSIIEEGSVSYSHHARREMQTDQLCTIDVRNVLRGGWVEPAELERGTYRYRVRTNEMVVVVAFRSDQELRVVTAWREKR